MKREGSGCGLSAAMASAAGALDEAVKEYLVYRGFTNTLRQFELEKKDDKDKGFRVSWLCRIAGLPFYSHFLFR